MRFGTKRPNETTIKMFVPFGSFKNGIRFLYILGLNI